jgi:hypothetical protein
MTPPPSAVENAKARTPIRSRSVWITAMEPSITKTKVPMMSRVTMKGLVLVFME